MNTMTQVRVRSRWVRIVGTLIGMVAIACGRGDGSPNRQAVESIEPGLEQTLEPGDEPLETERPEKSPDDDSPSSNSDALAETAPQTTKPRAEPAPRQPLTLIDEATNSTDFSQFRERLRQAVRDRDAEFIRAIATPDIKLTFGLPITLNDLDIDNPNADVWLHMEKAIATGCASQHYGSPSEQPTWICPHAFLAPDQSPNMDAFSQVIIVGQDVNVRAQPNQNSPVVGTLSNEAVRYDTEATLDLSEQQRTAMSTLSGWYPVITPSGDRGFVSSRYAYSPIGYRAFFEKIDGDWKMSVFIAGD